VTFHIVPCILLWIAAASSPGAATHPRPAARFAIAAALLALLVRAGATLHDTCVTLRERGVETVELSLSLSEQDRIERALRKKDGLGEIDRGSHWTLYRAIVEHVPSDRLVFAVAAPGNPLRRMLPTMQILTYPRWLNRQVSIPPEGFMSPFPGMFVLDLEDNDARLEGQFERTTSGRGWTLWELREQAPGDPTDATVLPSGPLPAKSE